MTFESLAASPQLDREGLQNLGELPLSCSLLEDFESPGFAVECGGLLCWRVPLLRTRATDPGFSNSSTPLQLAGPERRTSYM